MTGSLTPDLWLLVYEILLECEWRERKLSLYGSYLTGITYNPKDLLRLASVDRVAYSYFMSDQRWKLFDCYNISNNIAEHYVKTALSMSDNERARLIEVDVPRVTRGEFSLYTIYNQYRNGLDSLQQWHPNNETILLKDRAMVDLLQEACSDMALMGDASVIHPILLRSRDCVETLLSRNGGYYFSLANLASWWTNDDKYKMAILAASTHGRAVEHVPPELVDYELASMAVAQNRHVLDSLPIEYRDDSRLIELAEESEREDPLAELGRRPIGWNTLPYHLIIERQLELSETRWAQVAPYLPTRWWEVRQFVLVAVSQYGATLGYAPKFRDDKEVVLAAVRHYPSAVMDAYWDKVGDEELAFEVLSRTYSQSVWQFMRFKASHLFSNKAFMIRLMERRPFAYWACSSALALDSDIQDKLLKTTGKAAGTPYFDSSDVFGHKDQSFRLFPPRFLRFGYGD